MLEKVQDKDMYLDGTKVSFLGTNTSLAYLLGGNYGTTKRTDGFLTFYVKDVNGYVIPARMFDIQQIAEQGNLLVQLRKQPVKIRYVAQEFNGSLSLILSGIDKYTEPDFDYSRFLGKLDRASEILDAVNGTVAKYTGEENAFPARFATMSFNTICNAQSGGYVKFIQMVLNSVLAFKGTPGVEINDLVILTVKALNVFGEYLDLEERLTFVVKNTALEMTYRETQNLPTQLLKNAGADTISAVLGLGEPQHLYAHIISNYVLIAKKMLQYSYQYPLLIEGASKKEGRDTLVRY